MKAFCSPKIVKAVVTPDIQLSILIRVLVIAGIPCQIDSSQFISGQLILLFEQLLMPEV